MSRKAIGLGSPTPAHPIGANQKEDAIQALGVKDPGINPTFTII